jgi:hypothetical protein
MRIQKSLVAVVFALSAISMNVSAGMINNVDFPKEFVQAKEKAPVVAQEQVTASAEAK